MIELAQNYGNGPIYLKDIARRQEISEKYMSLIVIPLKAAGLVNSTRGAHGGYTVAKNPADITLKQIVDALEGETLLVDCVKYPSSCPRYDTCASKDLWKGLSSTISNALEAVTLKDLARKK